jgi:predicted amidohydrolase
MVVDPWGQVLGVLPKKGSEVVFAEIDPDRIASVRRHNCQR